MNSATTVTSLPTPEGTDVIRPGLDCTKQGQARRRPSRSHRPRLQGRLLANAMAVASAVLVVLSAVLAPSAQAHEGGSPINGRYLATSNGDQAKTNDVYHDEKTVREVWTITSTCIDSMNCTGQVSSSQGWSAPLNYDGVWWGVGHVVDNWQPCPDDTSASGDQQFRFWGVDAIGMTDDENAALLGGTNTTYGRSGDCGVNKQLIITLPLRLQKIDG